MNDSDDTATECATALNDCFAAVQGDLRLAFADLDPWLDEFPQLAWSSINAVAGRAWPRLRQVLSQRSDCSVLQQAWAALFHSSNQLGLLYRAGLANPDTKAEAQRLRHLTVKRWETTPQAAANPTEQPYAAFLMAGSAATAGVPNLQHYTAFTGRTRLRFRIAHLCMAGAKLGAVLLAIAGQPAVTAAQRRTELGCALHWALTRGRNWRKLADVEFALLSPATQQMVLQARNAWPAVLARPMHTDSELPQRAASMLQERMRLDGVLASLMQAIRARTLGEVDALMAQIPETPLSQAMTQRLRAQPWELHDVVGHASMRDDFGPWVPMSAQSLRRLQLWAPQPLPQWWAMTPTEVADALCSGNHGFETHQGSHRVRIVRQDLAPLIRAWSQGEQIRIIRAGQGQLLPHAGKGWQNYPLSELVAAHSSNPNGGRRLLAERLARLHDASAWISIMAAAGGAEEARTLRDEARAAIDMYWGDRWAYCWGRWIISAFGCPGWEKVEDLALEPTSPLRNAVDMFSAQLQPLVPGAFQQVVARSLHRTELLPRRTLALLKLWIKADALAAPALVKHAPLVWLERLASSATTPRSALLLLMQSDLPSVRQRADRNHRARTARAAVQECTHAP